jgi:hypothetical protein
MTDHIINLQEVILIFSCPFCGKINSISGENLTIDYQYDYGGNFTNETLLPLTCSECDEDSVLSI